MLILRKTAYIVCLLSVISAFQISFSKSNLFESSPYQPAFEFSLKSGHKRSLGRAGAVMPLRESDSGLWFTQLWGLWDSDAAKEWNVGLGYRHELADWIVGAYGFFDRRLSALNHYHSQLTVGAELLGENLETRINGYIPTTAAKAIGASVVDKANRVSLVLANLLEKPLGGIDVEVGGTLTPCKTLQGFLTYYHFNGSSVKAIDGVRLKGQLQLADYVALTGEASYDRLRKSSWFAGMQLSFRLGGVKKKVGLSQKMIQMVIRDIDVITDYTKEKAYQNRNATYPLQKTHDALIDKNAHFIEIKAFLASSSVRDKIQSIVIFSPNDIRLKPRTFDHLKSMDAQFISVPCYDIQRIPSCQNLKILSDFVHHSYWRITSIGKGYAIKAYVKGLGGGDREEMVSSQLSLLQLSADSSSSSQPQVYSEQAQNSNSAVYATQGGIAANHSNHNQFTIYQTIMHETPKSFKPKALGIRPSTNSQFVARQNNQGEDILEVLKSRFQQTSDNLIMQVITGIGGLGKTQLAVEYIRQTESNYDGIFWVQANQPDYQLYIEALEIDFQTTMPEALVPAIHKSLMHLDYKKILWVYDDVPNAEIFDEKLFNNELKSIWQRVKTQVHVLVTSRYMDWYGLADTIQLELFDTAQTKAYIESFFKEGRGPFVKPTDEEIDQFNHLLEGLPLAIVYAVDYIRKDLYSSRISKYIENYEKTYKQGLLNYKIKNSNNNKVIWTIWNITREKLSQNANLLLQMSCFLSNENISKLLFNPLWKEDIDKITKELADYSLIKFSSDFQSFSLHILLQATLQLQQDDEFLALEKVCVLAEKAKDLFDERELSTWNGMKLWVPHIASLLAWVEDDIELKNQIFFAYGKGAYFFGNYLKAKEYFSQALAIQRDYYEEYAEAHIEMPATLHNLATVEFDLGHYDKAKAHYNESLKLYKEHYGENHIEMAVTLMSLGNIEFHLRHYKESKKYYNQALEMQIRRYGENHVETATTLINLGNLNYKLDRKEVAKNYYTQALTIRERYYGKNHIELTAPLVNLGIIEKNLDHYEIAKGYYVQALTISTQHYGEDHIQVADILCNLGIIESNLGHYEEAKDYYVQALTISIQHYGKDHIHVADILRGLGNIESSLDDGENDEIAKNYYIQALSIQTQHYDEEYIELANTFCDLGRVESNLGDYEEAKKYYNQALIIQKKYYEKGHIKLADTLYNLGGVEINLEHYEEARSYYVQAFAIQAHCYGEDHTKLIDVLYNLGNVESELGHKEVAEYYYTQVLAIQKKHYERDYIGIAGTLYKLGNIESDLNHEKIAKDYYIAALTIETRYYGEEYTQRVSALHNHLYDMGNLEVSLGHEEIAKKYYTKALRFEAAFNTFFRKIK